MSDDHLLRLETLAIADGEASSTGHGYRVVARGEIDLQTAPRLAAELESLIERGALAVVLDASGVEFMDSSGLRVIVNGNSKLSAAGGRLLIDGMSGAVQRVLEISGLIEQYRTS
jgi:anti-sigma B factor antagonist